VLSLDQVQISIAGRELFSPLSLCVDKGQIVGIEAPSGTGKSILLRWILGALPDGFKAQGQLLLNGVDITQLSTEKRHLGLLLQQAKLFPHLSVADNIGFAIPSSPESGSADRNLKIAALLEQADLSGLGDRDPATLSGGQQARVALLRALAAEPRGLLLDEPFSSLDRSLKQQFRSWVFKQIRSRNIPGLIVSHDAEDLSECDVCVQLSPLATLENGAP